MNVLITGASRGIGLAEAKLLDKSENHLFLVAKSHDSFHDNFQHATIIAADLSTGDGVHHFLNQLNQHTDRIDVLINNVGVMVMKKFEDMNEADIDLMLNLNLRSHMQITRGVLGLLAKSECARVIFMSSMAAKSSIVGESVYAATKSAITNFANVLRNERPVGIRVSAVHAWGVDTFGAPPEVPLLAAEDIARAVEFIVAQPLHVLVESIDLGHVEQWRGGQAPWSPE